MRIAIRRTTGRELLDTVNDRYNAMFLASELMRCVSTAPPLCPDHPDEAKSKAGRHAQVIFSSLVADLFVHAAEELSWRAWSDWVTLGYAMRDALEDSRALMNAFDRGERP